MLLVCAGPRIASEERQWWQLYWWALGRDDGFMVFSLLLSRTCLPLVAGAGLQEWERSTNSCCRSSNHDHLLTHLSHQKDSWTEWCKVELHRSFTSLNKQTRCEEIGFPIHQLWCASSFFLVAIGLWGLVVYTFSDTWSVVLWGNKRRKMMRLAGTANRDRCWGTLLLPQQLLAGLLWPLGMHGLTLGIPAPTWGCIISLSDSFSCIRCSNWK